MKFVLKLKFVFNYLKCTALTRARIHATLILLMMLLNTGHTLASRVILRFKPRISDNATSLSDVLDITNPRQGLCDLSDLQLNSKPLKGETITSKQVIHWIHRQANCENFNIGWLGKTKAKIQGKTQTTAAQLTHVAEAALRQYLSKHYQEVTLTPLFKLKPSGLSIEQFTPHFSTKVDRRMRVWLDSPQQSLGIWFTVKVKQSVLVARRNLPARKTLQPSDFQLRLTDVTRITHPLTHIDSGYRLTREVKQGQTLTQADLSPLPAVSPGSLIAIKAKQGVIEITDQAIALSEGYLGDRIWVKNLRSNQRYRVKITAQNKGEALQ